MENQTYRFKTTLNCGGCVSKVKSELDQAAGIEEWEVNIDNPDKILTVKATNIDPNEVVQIVKSKGFQAEKID